MERRIGDVTMHSVEHGRGTPVLVLHGAGVDHREAEACFEPALQARRGFRRTYPDLPGMGRSVAAASLRSATDVLDTLLQFVHEIAAPGPILFVGQSAGAHHARGVAARQPDLVAGWRWSVPCCPACAASPSTAR